MIYTYTVYIIYPKVTANVFFVYILFLQNVCPNLHTYYLFLSFFAM